ncbi:hypothetical protein [Anaerotignum sp. MB30-C6]|uniref:hypothetical protein n=1 Tax=Anaerotignum sp. MB30-C6 TaxID=3070814 RepID=UPI0027DC5D36|nr:hypothetical protein [Anaerotignum sp. MB30-C6]WMI81812.1 hypothetical protein RBQ60_03535 [Anaerotignum sp. MB30-C6]
MKGSRTVSVLQGKEKECYITGRTDNLEKHHIYMGKNRKISDDNGFFVYLTLELHKGTHGVHGKHGNELDMKLKQDCQRAFEEENSHERFMELIGRNYL